MSHSSQESNLRQLRKELSDLTLDILELMGKRRETAAYVQSLKARGAGFYRFDYQRELEIFSHFKISLLDKSVKELLAISLMIEDHAQQGEAHTYPSWSSEVHLEKPMPDLFGQVNPVLLFQIRPDLFSQLGLRPEFSQLFK